MSGSFGLDAASALEKFRTAVKRFEIDALNEDLARDCAYEAWHLCDHAWQVLGSNSSFASLPKLRIHASHACPELAYLQSLSTTSSAVLRNSGSISSKSTRSHRRLSDTEGGVKQAPSAAPRQRQRGSLRHAPGVLSSVLLPIMWYRVQRAIVA